MIWNAGGLRLGMDDRGRLVELVSRSNDTNHLIRPVAVLSLRRDGHRITPDSARLDGQEVILHFPNDVDGTLRVRQEATHIALELTALVRADSFDVAVWGPYRTDMGEVIGETVGVVQAGDFALGIQALNLRTLGGYPERPNDTMPNRNVPLDNETGWGDDFVVYRPEAAAPDGRGSKLQAYVRNRSREREFPHRGYDTMVIPGYQDHGIPGTAIAFFGVGRERALETIGQIELAEGLPHPTLDGQWIKTSRNAGRSYISLEFEEDRLDQALDAVERAGLTYLYHEEPFSTWGAFTLDPQYFPDGEASLARMVQRAKARGISLGLHTLSNFVTPDDPLVTPRPSQGLVTLGAVRLAVPLTAASHKIVVDDTTYLADDRRSHLGAARMGDELIRYSGVSDSPPWQLLKVERGAFGTGASAHNAGTLVRRLDDHAYRVFLGDLDLSLEMAGRLAQIMRDSGVRQIGFDGLGGVQASGHGKYAENLFVTEWWNQIGPELRAGSMNSASGTTHWYWHIYSRMNWGEPWRGGFREAQLVRRLRQQDYYRRNFMQPMLGWFKMTPETSVEDVEWMLARSAGFDAGYCFVTIYETLELNGNTGRILDQMRIWEEARLAGAFPENLRTEMQDTEREYVLEEVPGGWLLHPLVTFEASGDAGLLDLSIPSDHEFHSLTIRAGRYGLSSQTFSLGDQALGEGISAPPGHIVRIRSDGQQSILTPTWGTAATGLLEGYPALRAPGNATLAWSSPVEGMPAPERVTVRYRKAPIRLERPGS